MHGGKSQGGVASRTFRDGRYSKYLPAQLLARYHESQEDAELLVLEEEIALLDARIADLLLRVDSGESGSMWRRLGAAWSEVEGTAPGSADRLVALAQLGDLIEGGASDYAAWAEVGDLIQQRRRLVESERRRLVEAQQTITAQQAMVLVSQLSQAVLAHVGDPHVRAAIAADIARLVGPGRL